MDGMKLFWGLLILSFGMLFIGINQGWVDSNVWTAIFSLWPVILIAIGLNLLVSNKRILTTLIVLLVLACVAFVLLTQESMMTWREDGVMRITGMENASYAENLTSTYNKDLTQNVDVTLSTGAAKVKISQLPVGSPDGTLYVLKTKNMGKIVTKQTEQDGRVVLQIEESGTGFHMNRSMMFERELELYLPVEPKINLILESGASKINLDLAALTIGSVNFDTGASTIDLYVGERAERQNIDFEAGASTVTFHLPKTIGIQATLDGGAMSVDSDAHLNIEKNGDTYKSKDFDSYKTQIVISGSAGVSKIKFEER